MNGEMTSNLKRGAFILFEGCDKCGKTTQSKRLVKFLENQMPVEYMNFPARETPIGNVINSYLKNEQELSNEGIHLLFSANRWEMQKRMRNLLESGVTLVVDRYSYSGVAYSVAKGLCYNWCKAPEKGLLRPDLVIYLRAEVQELSSRGDFGSERYEVQEFQNKVLSVFDKLHTEDMKTIEGNGKWYEIDASKDADDISTKIRTKVSEFIEKSRSKPFETLW